jgi:hypothetical protein
MKKIGDKAKTMSAKQIGELANTKGIVPPAALRKASAGNGVPPTTEKSKKRKSSPPEPKPDDNSRLLIELETNNDDEMEESSDMQEEIKQPAPDRSFQPAPAKIPEDSFYCKNLACGSIGGTSVCVYCEGPARKATPDWPINPFCEPCKVFLPTALCPFCQNVTAEVRIHFNKDGKSQETTPTPKRQKADHPGKDLSTTPLPLALSPITALLAPMHSADNNVSPSVRWKAWIELEQPADLIYFLQENAALFDKKGQKKAPKSLVGMYPLNSVEKWLKAFLNFTSCCVTANPHLPALPQLMLAYGTFFGELASKYLFPTMCTLDFELRKSMCEKKLPFGTIDPAIISQHMARATVRTSEEVVCAVCKEPHPEILCPERPPRRKRSRSPRRGGYEDEAPKKPSRPLGSSSRTSAITPLVGPPKDPETCREFNSNAGECRYDLRRKCKFKHVCWNCSGGHPVSKCLSFAAAK